MTYQGVARLRADLPFQQRVDAACFEQASIYKDDGRADIVALAEQVLRSGMPSTLLNAVCDSPGFSDKAGDTTAITDGEILSAVQADWPWVAALLFPQPEATE